MSLLKPPNIKQTLSISLKTALRKTFLQSSDRDHKYFFDLLLYHLECSSLLYTVYCVVRLSVRV